MVKVHRLALATIFFTFVLIFLGGVVHNSGSSLACPDWPLCFGQVFPKMEGGVAIEHSHRLLGALVGFLCILLVVFSQKVESRRIRRASGLVLGLVIFQGLLGGLTVKMQLSPIVSTLHLGTSQIILGILLYIALHTHKSAPLPARYPGQKSLAWAAGAIYFQMLLGAAIRHGGAGVACGLGPDAMFLCVEIEDFSQTFWPSHIQGQVHMLHRYMGVIAAAIVIATTLPLLRWAKAHGLGKIRALCISAHATVTLQIAIGVTTLATNFAIVPLTLHLVFAVLLWFVILSLNILVRKPL